jgi:3-phenylpropionate/trans-cinnamate dioxygenase ferredoxin reductase subunit
VTAPTCVVVGGNLAGGRAAETLRAAGFGGRVVLVGAEPDRPYERPPLSKAFLRGRQSQDALYLRPEGWYAEHGIELRLGTRATRLDLAARTVELDRGGPLGYDRLLLATGSRMRRLDVPGAGLDGIHLLRTIGDAQRLRAELARRPRVVVVGAGFIGTEVAACCRDLGLEVTMLEAAPLPLPRLGPELGRIWAGYHRDRGVDLRTGDGVAAFRGDGRVEAVVTSAGRVVACDLAVVGVGVVAETEWLAGSGLRLEDGVVTDEHCRTSAPGVWAAGDVAAWWHPRLGTRLRVEHVDNANNQAIAAAHGMLGRPVTYAPVPFVWSDQWDLHLQVAGHADRYDRVLLRGKVEDHSFVAFYLLGSEVRAAAGVNRLKEIAAARRLIWARLDRPERLADESVELRSLIPRAPA